jgi:hypothetical protein
VAIMQSVMGVTNCVKLLGKTKAQFVKIMGIDTGLQVIGQNLTMNLGAGPTIGVYGDDFVVSDHNHTGTVVNTVSIDGGATYGASKALGCPAEVKAVKLKSVDDLTTRIQNLSVTLNDNNSVCGAEPEYTPGPGVVEILEEHFEGSGAEVAWTKNETDGTVDYDQATTEETWGSSCARFTLPSGTDANILKTFAATQKMHTHLEFVIRAADFTGVDPGSGYTPLFIADGIIQEANRAGLQMNLYSEGGKTGDFNLDIMCMGAVDFYPNITITDVHLAYDVKHTIDVKWDNKAGGNLTVKIDGVEKLNKDLESMTFDEPSVLQQFDRVILGPTSQTYYPTISGAYTIDMDNIRITTDDWA